MKPILIIGTDPDDVENTIITLDSVEVWSGRDIGTLELVTAVAEALGATVEDIT